MLDLKFIRENLELVKAGVSAKNVQVDLDAFMALDSAHRKLLVEVETLKAERNKANDAISAKKAKKEDFSADIASMKSISQKIAELDAKVGESDKEMTKNLLYIPNIPEESVPIGKSPEQNKVVKEVGVPIRHTFKTKNHVEIGEKLGLDMQAGAKISGSGFYLLKGHAARLERALINLFLDIHTKNHGYTEVCPPLFVNRRTMTGTGQLPKFEVDLYRLAEEDMFLIPTAEVPVTNIHQDEVLPEEELTKKYTAYTPCFRREAGSYGKDTKGLTRVHQFDKVELVKFTRPEDSGAEHETLLQDAEAILNALELPYRVVLLCSGDMSFSASKCYDLEVWAPGVEKWLEVSSCSNFRDFQARRANIKFKRKATGKTEFVHTLNASGLALPRIVIALWENSQDAEGNIHYPKALLPYLN